MKKKATKAKAKKVSSKEIEEIKTKPPSFDELAFAAALADFKRTQEAVLLEIQGVKKPPKIQCPKCKKKFDRKALGSYVCSDCPGTVYLDAASGIEIRSGAGFLTNGDQIQRLAAARVRVAEAKSRVDAQ